MSNDDLSDKLDEKMDQREGGFPPAWKPEQGDKLIGEVTARNEGVPHDYGTCAVLQVQTQDNGMVSLWLSMAVLSDQLSNVEAGDEIAVGYCGKTESSGGNEYHDFVVEVDRDESNESEDQDRRNLGKFDAEDVPF